MPIYFFHVLLEIMPSDDGLVKQFSNVKLEQTTTSQLTNILRVPPLPPRKPAILAQIPVQKTPAIKQNDSIQNHGNSGIVCI